MPFEIIGAIENIETITVGGRIREFRGFVNNMVLGDGGNLKVSPIRLTKGSIRRAEVHWYEVHGINW